MNEEEGGERRGREKQVKQNPVRG
jgi:hypothetical protein